MRIIIKYVDGTEDEFPETSRAGGSYCTSYKLESGWVIIKNAYGNETIIPSERITNIKTYSSAW